MTEYTFKNIANLEVVEELTDDTTIVVENNGSLKRIDKEQIDKNINVTGTLRIEDGATLEVAEGATVNGLATEYQPTPLFFYVDDLVLYKDAEFTEGVTIADVNDVLTGYILQGGVMYRVVRVDSTMPAGFHAYILDGNGSLIPLESTDFEGGVE